MANVIRVEDERPKMFRDGVNVYYKAIDIKPALESLRGLKREAECLVLCLQFLFGSGNNMGSEI